MATTVVATRSPVALAGAATFVLIESAKEIVRAMNRIEDNYGKLTATGSLAGSSTYQMGRSKKADEKARLLYLDRKEKGLKKGEPLVKDWDRSPTHSKLESIV